jgi:uroporphyrinogen-III decarboxylase
MTEKHWSQLLDIINGKIIEPMPVGFIIDCPWLPNWYGVKVIDYFTSDEIWLKANMKVHSDFPEVMFLPGFWSEYGMCTEPSAFGAKCIFFEDEFPHAQKMIFTEEDIDRLEIPDPTRDGLLPFMLNRLKLNKSKIEDSGHSIKFSVSRGPLNIASYLMGTTEFLTLLMMDPDKAHLLIQKITSFLKNWHQLQRDTFPSIDGILLLDDIIGFMSGDDFKEFGLQYFKEIYDADVSVKFLHNDAPCESSMSYLPEMGVNLFNMGFEISLNELKTLSNNQITMLGNIPPRDVLAGGTPDDIRSSVSKLKNRLHDKSRVILSCGGGMPPGVSTENLNAFLDEALKS